MTVPEIHALEINLHCIILDSGVRGLSDLQI